MTSLAFSVSLLSVFSSTLGNCGVAKVLFWLLFTKLIIFSETFGSTKVLSLTVSCLCWLGFAKSIWLFLAGGVKKEFNTPIDSCILLSSCLSIATSYFFLTDTAACSGVDVCTKSLRACLCVLFNSHHTKSNWLSNVYGSSYLS